MESCKRLKEYAIFVAKVRELHEKGYSMEQSVDAAVEYCIRNGVMKDILQPFRAEVKKMLLTGYDEKRIGRMFRKEGIEEGRKIGIEEGRNQLIISMFQNGLSAEKISDITQLSIQEIKDIKSAHELSDHR